jgi:hypothetical protein
MKDLYIGNKMIANTHKDVSGRFMVIGNETFYEIEGYDSMQPFLISIASDSNHWMFISSTGGLTAGRANADNALFPYNTDDKIHECYENTGSKSILRVQREGKLFLWEPFSDRYKGVYSISRRILKSTIGNKVLFEERNSDLGLTFGYGWMSSDEYGWIRKSWLVNSSANEVAVEVLDGMQNILPYGTNQFAQAKFSTLVDAYKKNELIPGANLALYRMESLMVDRAEPGEALRATTVWCSGLEGCHFLLSSAQLDSFRLGKSVTPESETKGVRGAFFACKNLILGPLQLRSWYFVAELSQDSVNVNNLIIFLKANHDLGKTLEDSVARGTNALLGIIRQADGVQGTADTNNVARHFSNTLYNVMRGGIYSDGYQVGRKDFARHIEHFNLATWSLYKDFLGNLPDSISHFKLEELIKALNDANLYRLFLEYLPLTFSRRHGDPSRPWNAFNINIKDNNGEQILYYQGNWRDIFQNWEALSVSYPGFINSIIAKFLNASTADGYNPYRITKDGIDWEVIEPDNPWSNIGYWGDHQIVYLLRLLELSSAHYPGSLREWLNREVFAYANVPYRIKGYPDIVANPKNTVDFDAQLNRTIGERVLSMGADARLVLYPDGSVMHVSLTEKLLVTLLTKLGNFIPGAGIWMNTLRPEWNDANNALVGNGASMVTLCYLRRFVVFMLKLYTESEDSSFPVSVELAGFFSNIVAALVGHKPNLYKGFDDSTRRQLVNMLGLAGQSYRNSVYRGFTLKKEVLKRSDIRAFLNLALAYIDDSISANRRPDGMYHSYNLVHFQNGAVSIEHLYEMLEGQVAVLSSGMLTAKEKVHLLESLRSSSLYRADQNSYILYPNRQLPRFIEKNIIHPTDLESNALLRQMVESGDSSIVAKDKLGQFHFNADFVNANHLKDALNRLKKESEFEFDDKDIENILAIYEKVFNHKAFTGRSGTFYKYEGLGSIYWHMVSKLLLAIGESVQQAQVDGEDRATIDKLVGHFHLVKLGIGSHKSPAEYGAFPFDPYSHTPQMAGAQQPGMTGQVKEDIISRFFELGIMVSEGQIHINPLALKRSEFIPPKPYDAQGFSHPYILFTYCSVPFVYLLDGSVGIDICGQQGEVCRVNGYTINTIHSGRIFRRDESIRHIIVHLEDCCLA